MKEYTINIDKRPVLPDRIQVNVTPNFMNIYELKNNIFEKKWVVKPKFSKLKDLIIENRKKKKLTYKTFRSKNEKSFFYMIDIPSPYSFITNIRLNALAPFSVSFKINFIRLLREKIEAKNELNESYDKKIMLDDDNYINYGIWPDWDYNIITDIINHLDNICLEVAKESLYYVIGKNKLCYEKVTVKQIETNVDYNTGSGNSLLAINTFLKIFNSKEGYDFRKNVSEIATKCRIPSLPLDDPTNIEKNESVSVQFKICNGLFLKIYRKTRDDIRAELLFESNYLKSKFYNKDIDGKKHYSTDIRKIIKPVMEFSKDFFKTLEFESYIKKGLSGNTELFVQDYIKPVYDILQEYFPELWDLIICVKNNFPITDINTKKFIQGKKVIKVNRELAKNFKRIYRGDKGYSYVYLPEKKHNIKKKENNEILLKKPDSNTLKLYNDYKKHFPDDRIFLGWDGKTFIHKGERC